MHIDGFILMRISFQSNFTKIVEKLRAEFLFVENKKLNHHIKRHTPQTDGGSLKFWLHWKSAMDEVNAP